MIDLNLLNPQQRMAVEHTEGPLLVLAGAGSGKTRVLTYRVAHLLELGVPAWRILAITFTNKAAKEMLERVRRLTGEAGEQVWISTFHSCCCRILRRDIEKLQGYKRSFTICDSDDSMRALKSVCKSMQLDEKIFPPKLLRNLISDAKNKLLTPDEWLGEAGHTRQNEKKAEVYRQYEALLRRNNSLDFDDLLVKTLVLFTEHPPVLDYYQQRFDYVLVDEYQDTNAAQYELVRLLTQKKRNLCVVGDDDQSIYGWRGADIRNILDFEKDYPETFTIKLEQNYRSTANILDAANQVIAHNRGRKEKALWTESDSGEKIALYEALDERDEAVHIARKTARYIKNGIIPGEIAVLYRANAQSRVIEEAFVRSGIAYRVYGAHRFYDRKEVKDVLAYMRLMVNPDDDLSLQRIINEPKRGIGDTSIAKLSEFAADNEMSMLAACTMVGESDLNTRAKKQIAAFGDVMLELADAMVSQDVETFVETLLDKTGYVNALKAQGDEEAQGRLENIRELQGAITEFMQQHEGASIADYLENVTLVSDTDAIDEGGGSVTLTTLHSAKGLEFDVVFLSGMEERIFPTARAMFEDTAMEEERRLAYVGLTRAKKHLQLSCARSRALYNTREMNSPSRFIAEIPPRLIQRESLTNAHRVPPPSGGYNRGNSASREPMPARASTIPTYVPSAASRVKVVEQFKQGDAIYHKTFGKGVVVSVTGTGREQKLFIQFDRTGNKIRSFKAEEAPITKL